MSRTLKGDFLFGDLEKEAFRRMMWRMVTFSGVEILTYVVMSNHFHILVKVPDRQKWLRKFEAEISRYREQNNQQAIDDILEKFRKRFCDVSLFVKALKERFSRWLNKQLARKGTLWMYRFKSVLVQSSEALATMAAYIDLNPVRAGLVDDPSKYDWSGYGEAHSGSRRARRGICKALNLPQNSWEGKALSRYRCFLYEEGLVIEESENKAKTQKRKGFTKAQLAKVHSQERNPKRHIRMTQRIHAFTEGKAFVEKFAQQYREQAGRKNVRNPKQLKIRGKETGFTVFRE